MHLPLTTVSYFGKLSIGYCVFPLRTPPTPFFHPSKSLDLHARNTYADGGACFFASDHQDTSVCHLRTTLPRLMHMYTGELRCSRCCCWQPASLGVIDQVGTIFDYSTFSLLSKKILTPRSPRWKSAFLINRMKWLIFEFQISSSQFISRY